MVTRTHFTTDQYPTRLRHITKMAAEQEINIKFVQEVENYPCLYNYNIPEYMRKNLTKKAWTEIGKKFQLSGPECKEKWKNLRSVFARQLKPPKIGTIPVQKKPYYLTEYMQFVVPFVKIPATEPNQESNSEEKCYYNAENSYNNERSFSNAERSFSSTEKSFNNGEKSYSNVEQSFSNEEIPLIKSEPLSPPEEPSQSEFIPPPSASEAVPSTSSQSTAQPQPSNTQQSQSKIVFELPAMEPKEREFQTKGKPIKRKKYDASEQDMSTNVIRQEQLSNKMFLLSLLSDMNKMNDKQRRVFKQRVLELVDDIILDLDSSMVG